MDMACVSTYFYLLQFLSSVSYNFPSTDILHPCVGLFIGILIFLLFKRFHLFIFRERGREGERERNINVWLPLTQPLLGTWPKAQVCALTGNQTGNLLVCGPALSPLSYPAGADFHYFKLLSYPIMQTIHL